MASKRAAYIILASPTQIWASPTDRVPYTAASVHPSCVAPPLLHTHGSSCNPKGKPKHEVDTRNPNYVSGVDLPPSGTWARGRSSCKSGLQKDGLAPRMLLDFKKKLGHRCRILSFLIFLLSLVLALQDGHVKTVAFLLSDQPYGSLYKWRPHRPK